MLIFKTKKALSEFVVSQKQSGAIIGFVPTMGALHAGHVSLIRNSLDQTDITIASIFVNPTQFNDKNDFTNYPRKTDKDIEMLELSGCHALFLPTEEEMYPDPDTRIFNFDGLDRLMEGEHRPGHFNGVAQIVSKLFDAVSPHKAFFGQKDFQQLAIIKKMVGQLKFSIQIVSCPIVREPDGLAMSSRNSLLTDEHRSAAPVIYKTLLQAKEKAIELNVIELKQWVADAINKTGLLKVEYFEIVDNTELTPVTDIRNGRINVGCIAIWAGKVRLIDNIVFNL